VMVPSWTVAPVSSDRPLARGVAQPALDRLLGVRRSP
jgi:hypothetical protein